MKKVADIFSTWLAESEIIGQNDRELYEYGFWQGVVLLFNFLTVVVIGIIIDMLWQSIVFKLAPVEDDNKPLDDVEVVVYRHRSRIIYGGFTIVVSILLLVNEIEIASCIVVSILAVSVMLVLGETRKRYAATMHSF